MIAYYILDHNTLEIEAFYVSSLENIFIDNIITFDNIREAQRMRDYLDTDIKIN